MPGRDGTGPRGQGPMTGGGFGPCAGNRAFGVNVGRVGLGRRQGAGYGFRARVDYAAPESEKESLRLQKELLENRLKQVESRLDNL